MSILAEELPDKLPAFCECCCLADSFYDDVPVVIVSESDTQQSILQTIGALALKGGKCGVVLLIWPVEVVSDEQFENVAKGPLRLHVDFQAWELTQRGELDNANPKTAYQVIRHTFDLFSTESIKGLVDLFVSGTPVIEKLPPPDGANLKGWQLNFTVRESISATQAKVARPTFSPASGAAATVSISCATAGADIYFTIDGTAPTKDKTLYSAPITVPAEGFTLFAQASKPGSFPSNINSASFTPA